MAALDEKIISLATQNMQGENFNFLNRDNLQIHGRIWNPNTLKSRLVIVVHGLAGSSRQAQIEGAVASFLSAGCNVLTYDATNSFGSSGGDLSRASLPRHANDLEDVILWCRNAFRFTGDIIICGFSMGASAAFVVQNRAENHIRSIIAFAPIVSGRIWLHNFRLSKPGSYARYEATGSFAKFDDVTGREAEITSEFVEDVLKYDFLSDELDIRVPTYLIGGSLDTTCPPEALEALVTKIKVVKKIKIIDGLPHTARNPQEVKLIRDFLLALIKKSKDDIWPALDKRRVSNARHQ